VVEVSTINELFNLAWALGSQPLPKGKRVAITTNAGGAAALAADSLDFNGFSLAKISPEIQSKMHEKLNPSAQVSNPVDMLGSVSPADYLWSLQNLNDDDGVDVLLPILVPQSLVDVNGVADAWVEVDKMTDKTLLTCLMGERSTQEAEQVLNSNNVPVFNLPELAGPVLKGMWEYRQVLDSPVFEEIGSKDACPAQIEEAKAAIGDRKVIGEYESRMLLDAYQIPNVPGGLAKTADEAVEIAEKVGYPVVLKIVAEGLIHKSDAGGIVLNIQNSEEMRVAYKDLIERIHKNEPEAEIIGAMVEKMAAKGVEVIVGMRRDATFGPLMMFGMGGTLVELVKDIQFRVAPLSREDIETMVAETMAGKLLNGYRGAPKADFEAVYAVIAQLSKLAMEQPEIQEIEINPLIVYPEGQGAIAIDSRMILD
jgi:acetyltransferase